jgi:nitrogen PTS system EIIA component
MDLKALVEPGCAVVGAKVSDKAQALDLLARTAAGCSSVGAETIRNLLAAREELGSTGLGRRFALPHARVEGLRQMLGVVLTLARPIDFASIDGEPVDLVFCLLVPPQAAADQVRVLSSIARRMREPGRMDRLRKAKTPDELLKALSGP